MTAEIRKARLTDLIAIVALGYEAVTSKTWQGVKEFNAVHVMHTTTDLIANDLVFVAEAEGNIVGIHVLHGQGWVWSRNEHFIESVLIYVTPQARATRDQNGDLVATGLMKAAMALADIVGAKLSVPLMWGDEEVVALRDEYVRRLGMTYIGGTFMHIPAHAMEDEAA